MNNSRTVKTAIFIGSLLAIVVTGLLPRNKEDNLCITEVCTHNESAAHDEYGDYSSDYIEIYNPTEETVNLLGWGLSDDSSNTRKFLFPDMSIEPGQAIIVWSSEDKYPPEQWRDDYVPSDVHGLGFNLSDGEACILTDPDGKIVSTAVIPQYLAKNTTISASLSALNTLVVDEATPYYVKDEIVLDGAKELLDAPIFSTDGGWYDDPVTLELSCEEGDIFYTLDGTDPDENSLRYQGPITIENRTKEDNYYLNLLALAEPDYYIPDFNVDKGTVVKAVAISDSGRSGVVSRTYLVGLDREEYEGVSIMALTISPDDFFGYETGIYRRGILADSVEEKIDWDKVEIEPSCANYEMKSRGWERDVSIQYLDQEHELMLNQDAGIRIHGGNSVGTNQKSFNLYAREEYDGSQYFNCDFYGNGNQYNKLVLRNGGGEDMYLAKMRDVFDQSLVMDRSVGTQEAIPCVVFLNGEYWGLYNLQEKACDNYVYNHYDVPEEEVAVVKRKYQEYVATNEEDEDYAKEYVDLVDYVVDNDMSVEENYRYVETRIDIQSLIDYYVLKIYTGCIDAFYNNEAMWRSKNYGAGEYQDGKWRFLANDLDSSTNMHTGMTSPEVDTFIEANWISKKGPLVDEGLLSSLMENPEFKQRFVTSFMDMMNYNFDHDRISAELWERADVVRIQNVKSQQVFRGDFIVDNYPGIDDLDFPYDEEDFGYDVGLIDVFFAQRPDYMKEYIRRDLELEGGLYTLNVLGEVPAGMQLQVNTSVISDFAGEWSGEYFGDYPVTLSLVGEDGSELSGACWYVDGQMVSSEASYMIPAGFGGDHITVEIH